jgi:AraC-like DNA-binding protein
VFYGLLIFFVSKKNRDTIFQGIPQKYNAKKIDEQEVDSLIDKLNVLMKGEELYKNTNVKLLDVAKKLQVTTHKLSQLLNDNIGKSFASFLNDYRVEESKRLLREQHKFTIESVGFEAGFSSKSNFYATFKKVVGKTPIQYQKEFL